MSSYVFWANKGGIGKSTMTFQLACAVALKNDRRKVYIIDLSPQCDVSRMVFGGGHFNGEVKILDTMKAFPRKTIQSYLLECLNDVTAGIGWPNPLSFITKPNNVRDSKAEKLPSNLRLLCGDFDLERTIQLMSLIQQPPRRAGRAPIGPEYSAPLLIRSFLRDAVEKLSQNGQNIVIIDTDPYFSVVTTQMGLLAADNWLTAYSPSSQASQYAVLRSIEFMYEQVSGLARFVKDEYIKHPFPWFDNKGNPMSSPQITVAAPFLLLANMVNPYRKSGNTSYTDPQRLHEQTINKLSKDIATELRNFNRNQFAYLDYMWDMRRLGLICDYNGIGLNSLRTGKNYPEPGSSRRYYLNATGGTPGQLQGYLNRLNSLASIL